ncbi:MAG: metallophosphoesterase [Chlorobiaceae bacterium]|jgi:predicted phosphodiesterase|nr:metallophosphoesterase [Chlorobiaceae bacterium]
MFGLHAMGLCFGVNSTSHHTKKHFHLDRLLNTAKPIYLNHSSKVLILSDLHMGNGGRLDEFRQNSELVKAMLEKYYLPEKYSLVLNGDIEELFKFSLESIVSEWKDFYDLFLEFEKNGFFWKTWGNHDAALLDMREYRLASSLVESVKFHYEDETILLFHGHQAALVLWQTCSILSRAVIFFLRYFAKPLGIRNFSVAYNSRQRFAIEQLIYEFSNQSKIVSIIGHTHRPLFESLSKADFLNYRIEELCRSYRAGDSEKRSAIKQTIIELKIELDNCYKKGKISGLRSGIYNNITIPSVFNSGCTIGKRGITAIEIEGSTIRLVYWYNGKQNRKFISERDNRPMELGLTGFSRIVLNEDSLDYVFSRLHLLA